MWKILLGKLLNKPTFRSIRCQTRDVSLLQRHYQGLNTSDISSVTWKGTGQQLLPFRAYFSIAESGEKTFPIGFHRLGKVPGSSRVIASEKASTANGLSGRVSPISTANAYAASQPGRRLLAACSDITINAAASPSFVGQRECTAFECLVALGVRLAESR